MISGRCNSQQRPRASGSPRGVLSLLGSGTQRLPQLQLSLGGSAFVFWRQLRQEARQVVQGLQQIAPQWVGFLL